MPNVPELAVKLVPAIPATKSAILSFFELLSLASMIGMLSASTATVAAVNSFKSNASETAPLEPPPLRPSPAVTALMSPVSEMLNCPELAESPDPAIALTKSAIDSFLLELSPASIIAILSASTATVAAVNSFKSNAMLNAPEVPPPLKPSPAVTAVMSPISEYFASLCPPAVEPSWTLMVSKSVSTVISPTSPVNELCCEVVPRLH